MTAPEKISNAGWLNDAALQKVLLAVSTVDDPARINGGAVRNAILGEPIADVDISTVLTPDEVEQKLAGAGIRSVATGKDHGTITAVINSQGYEITTLREDMDTDGRRAVVRFGREWKRDAQRRDFTMNALYCDGEGNLFDPLDGHDDIINRRVRFIGDAEQRIREDFLRILRFFRFFAWYGAFRPDRDGLKACTRLKGELSSLSAERVWSELKKLLRAPDPRKALLWMRTSGVLENVLPEGGNWGIDLIHPLVDAEQANGWTPDPMLRLMAMLPDQDDRLAGLAKRLKLSNAEKDRLLAWATSELPALDLPKDILAKQLYRDGTRGLSDRLRLEVARCFKETTQNSAAQTRLAQLTYIEIWKRPVFPVTGKDLIKAGVTPGQALGKELKRLEGKWVDSGFKLAKNDLLTS